MKHRPTDKKDVWLVPKRASMHQFIGVVDALIENELEGKVWNSSRQELIATRLRQKGLTKDRNFSHQSVRTLFANGPKFMGFAYTDDGDDATRRGSKVFITKAGRRLNEEGLLNTTAHYAKLQSWERDHSLADSRLLKIQLLKLILNNPITNNGGQILVYPFLSTLKLCRKLGYLDFEEIAYIVFSMSAEDELDLITQRIINFRSLSPSNRKNEIEAYSKTNAGRLTMVKAPLANYFIAFCCLAGLFEKSTIEIDNYKKLTCIRALSVPDLDFLDESLSGSIYNFYDNRDLWIEYIGDPDVIRPPRDITLSITTSKPGNYYVEVRNENTVKQTLSIEGSRIESLITVFEGKTYEITLNYLGAKKRLSQIFTVEPMIKEKTIHFTVDDTGGLRESSLETNEDILGAIKSLSESKTHIDKGFYDYLKLREKIEGKNFINNNVRGGRLEYLFFRLLSNLYEQGSIDYLKWFGKVSDDGLPRPAPGGKNGNPDLVFVVDDISVIIELTTIMGTANQWQSSEAASVPDHIFSYSEESNTLRNVGIFSAPSINNRVESNFDAQSKMQGVPIKCIDLISFSNALTLERPELIEFLLANS